MGKKMASEAEERSTMNGRRYIPAWKDKHGNRLIFIASNHIHESWDAAFQHQAADFLFYIPYGLVTGGIFEVDLVEGRADFPHLMGDAPHGAQVAYIDGPALTKALEAA